MIHGQKDEVVPVVFSRYVLKIFNKAKKKILIIKNGDHSLSNQKPLKKLLPGDQITLKKGERHRLIGLSDFAVIAEIWQHTDPNNPSDEKDIVRLSDDYGR